MNFEQLKLRIHMRSLYERLGALDAELLIVDAFVQEQARHERMQDLVHASAREPGATTHPDNV